jgi:hypothetical protein
MGMYTKLFLDCSFRSDIPEVDMRALEYLFDGADKPEILPSHTFFSKNRAHYMFQSPAYTGPAVTVKLSDYYDNHVTAHIEVKNYEDEIEAFIDWARPLLAEEEGHCVGWKWFEEADNPTLIYA